MKILHVITSLLYGGAEKIVADICPIIRNNGHQVEVLAFNGAEPNFKSLLEDNGIKVYTFGINANVYNPTFILRLAKMMKSYDIIHTHNTSPQFFAALGSLINFKCKFVTTEHNSYNSRRSLPVFKHIDRWMYSRYQSIICISDQAESNIREYLPKTMGICTIYNGVDVAKFHYAKPIEGMHKEGKIVVVMVAGFRPQKDQDTLIKAFHSLDENKFELWIVGDGERRDELESCAAGKQNIKFLGVRSDIPEILHSADIVVMSSHYEGLSLSSVEGMSVGKPFIASDVDGLREVVDGYGILVPHQDSSALADAIVRLATDNVYYQQIADKCWERAQMFDIQKMVEGYLKVYEGIIKH